VEPISTYGAPVKTKHIWVLASITIATGGCQSTPMMADDVGVVVPDAAAADDAAVGHPDTGNGTCGTVDGDTIFPPLPASCVPMCDEASRTALASCGALDFQCRRDAVAFDAGTIVLVDGPLGPRMVSCGGSRTGSVWPCFGWQETSCEAEFCPDEYTAYIQCVNRGTGSCSSEDAAVLSCLNASTDYQTCVVTRVSAC
jgi:hypothetical protein